MTDKADKSWIQQESEKIGFNMNRLLVEDYEKHYQDIDSKEVKSKLIFAAGLTIALIALIAAVK